MKSINAVFCKSLLATIHDEVRKHKPNVRLRDAWVYHHWRDHWEFHYGDFYWHGSADSATDARVKGWEKWLNHERRDDHCTCGHRRELHGTTSGECADCSCGSFLEAVS